MRQIIASSPHRISRKFHLRVAEWFGTAIMLTMGVQFALVPTMFATNPFFNGMAQEFPQSVWAVGLIAVGLARLGALLVNGAWRWSPHVRAGGAVCSCLLWCCAVKGLMVFHYATVGMDVFPYIIPLDIYCGWRAGAEAALADAHAKTRALL